jgi:hypothetical protein
MLFNYFRVIFCRQLAGEEKEEEGQWWSVERRFQRSPFWLLVSEGNAQLDAAILQPQQ